MTQTMHFLDPRQSNRAASCVHSLPGYGEFGNGVFLPVYLCSRTRVAEDLPVCLLILGDPLTRCPLECTHYYPYVGHEEIPAEQR